MDVRLKAIYGAYHNGCVRSVLLAERHSNLLLASFGLTLILVGMNDVAHAQVEYIGERAYEVADDSNGQSNFYRLISGAFGSLVMVVAGLGAMVSAAMGSYKAAVGMLVVAVGSFCIRASINVTLGYDNIRYTNASQ